MRRRAGHRAPTAGGLTPCGNADAARGGARRCALPSRQRVPSHARHRSRPPLGTQAAPRNDPPHCRERRRDGCSVPAPDRPCRGADDVPGGSGGPLRPDAGGGTPHGAPRRGAHPRGRRRRLGGEPQHRRHPPQACLRQDWSRPPGGAGGKSAWQFSNAPGASPAARLHLRLPSLCRLRSRATASTVRRVSSRRRLAIPIRRAFLWTMKVTVNEDSASSRRSTVMRPCPRQSANMRVTQSRSALRRPSSHPALAPHPPPAAESWLTTVVPGRSNLPARGRPLRRLARGEVPRDDSGFEGPSDQSPPVSPVWVTTGGT